MTCVLEAVLFRLLQVFLMQCNRVELWNFFVKFSENHVLNE